jgi:uncharacterized membrane protein YjfL (UPF0719 family)
MKLLKWNVILVFVLILGFIAFARYIVRLNQDIQIQISAAGPGQGSAR